MSIELTPRVVTMFQIKMFQILGLWANLSSADYLRRPRSPPLCRYVAWIKFVCIFSQGRREFNDTKKGSYEYYVRYIYLTWSSSSITPKKATKIPSIFHNQYHVDGKKFCTYVSYQIFRSDLI